MDAQWEEESWLLGFYGLSPLSDREGSKNMTSPNSNLLLFNCHPMYP